MNPLRPIPSSSLVLGILTRGMAVLLGLGALTACAAGVQSPRAALGDNPGALLFNGYANPEVNCFHCHNGDGAGSGRGPNLTERIPRLTDDEIVKAINKGPGFMPSFKDKLNDVEKQQLVAWLRSRFGGPGASAK